MTVSYSDEVATHNGFAFLKLLARWKGSVYKLLWKDLLVFLTLYYLIHLVYLLALTDEQKLIFGELVSYTTTYGNFIPLSFVLGFYVSVVMTRWWDQYQSIPWPTSIAVFVSSTISGYDEVGRAMRRTIMRYVCLSLTMVLRVLSPRVRKRFPKMADLIEAGLIHENELKIIEDLESQFPGYGKNFLPIVWAASIVKRARKEGRIEEDHAVKTIIKELDKFRGLCGSLMAYNAMSVPLVYTQVVTIAVYSYFITALIAQQSVEQQTTSVIVKLKLDFIPFLVVLQFIFYMGWLKVAETLMNPFGEDDDDFEVNLLIDRNLQMSYLIVDDMHNEHPLLLKDQYWNEMPTKLPDKGKNENDKADNRAQDLIEFEVIERTGSILRHRTTAILQLPPKQDDVGVGRRVSFISPDLIPRASVISGRFKNDAEVMKEQIIIEKGMEEIQKEQNRSSTEDSVSIGMMGH